MQYKCCIAQLGGVKHAFRFTFCSGMVDTALSRSQMNRKDEYRVISWF